MPDVPIVTVFRWETYNDIDLRYYCSQVPRIGEHVVVVCPEVTIRGRVDDVLWEVNHGLGSYAADARLYATVELVNVKEEWNEV